MGSTSTRKSSAKSSRRRPHKAHQDCRRSSSAAAASVPDKLEALKNLIPCDGAGINADQLFQETADYIVLLKTQVFVLQKLIDFYGSQPQQNSNAV